MAKYLLLASYSAEGSKGLMKVGGTKRVTAARTLVESLGGKLESLYFAFGDTDVVAIVDLPDNATGRSCVADDRWLRCADRKDDRPADAGRHRPGGQEIRHLYATRALGVKSHVVVSRRSSVVSRKSSVISLSHQTRLRTRLCLHHDCRLPTADCRLSELPTVD